jgi:hypothetical protein
MNQFHQRGATMWTTLSVVFMIGFILYLGAIIGNIFLDHKFIAGSMQEVVNQSNFKSMSKKDVLSTINKRLTIDNIRGLDKSVINVKRERSGNGRYIHVKYEKKSKLFANVNIVVEFDEEIRPSK